MNQTSPLKTKLLVLASTYPKFKNEGISPFVHELSLRLTSSFDVFVLAPRSKGDPAEVFQDGISVSRFKYWFDFSEGLGNGSILPRLKKNKWLWFQVPFFLFFQMIQIHRLVSKHHIGMVHAHWILPQGLLAVLYAAFFKKNMPVVVTSHGADVYALTSIMFLKKWALERCNHLTVVSHAMKSQVLRWGIQPKKISVEPMGVDLNRFNPSKKNSDILKKHNIVGPFLLFVGRLSEKKGLPYLISAMKIITKTMPTTTLLIAGSGEDFEGLQELAKRENLLNQNVFFLGPLSQNQLPEYYASADLFIAPFVIGMDGDQEGMPVTIMESIASDCLILTTDIACNQEIFGNAMGDCLVPAKNSVALAEATLEILSDHHRQNRMRQCLVELRTRFGWDGVAERYQLILKNA